MYSWDTQKDKRFDPFLIDTDGDGVEEQHHFERRPLHTEIYPSQGTAFRVLGLHLKSKGIFDALEWSKWWDMSDGIRKKIIAEAAHVHDLFVDPYLTDSKTKQIPLIVCGDINDGPGLDASEKRLFGSGIERLMGNIWQPELCLGNAIFDSLKKKEKDDLNFKEVYTTSYRDPIFNNTYQKDWIDHILYSKSPAANWIKNAQIHHKMPDGKNIWEKYKNASDHHPVSVEVITT
jgi:endonuclease/exonuclease/phosphatase family metal-dependent hydrolase